VLRRSAAYFGIPPLYGGEITIILFAALFLRRDTLGAFCRNPYGLASIIFAILPLPYIIVQFRYAGTESIMYSSVAYYAVFLYFGYSIVSTTEKQKLFIRILYYALLFSNIHFLVSNVIPLKEVSPSINGVSLLGHSDSCYIYYGFGIAYALIFFDELGLTKAIVLLSSSILGHVLSTERGSQLGILGVLLVLVVFRKIWFKYDKRFFSLLTLFGGSILAAGILIVPQSAFAKKIGLQLDLFSSIFSNSENVVRAGTKRHRLEMWNEIIDNTLKEDPALGQGVKGPLIDVAFKHPHNSFITIFGRFGIVGLFLALTIYFVMPAHNMMVLTRTNDPNLQQIMLLYLCFVPAFMGAVLFGPTLESPFSALICNFFYGAFLRCGDIIAQRTPAPACVRFGQMAG
jgi:O-antigen ligase